MKSSLFIQFFFTTDFELLYFMASSEKKVNKTKQGFFASGVAWYGFGTQFFSPQYAPSIRPPNIIAKNMNSIKNTFFSSLF